MTMFSRTDMSLLGQWWWTVDRWTIAAIIGLVTLGVFLIMAASPSIAEGLKLDTFHFVGRQLLFLPLAMISMFCVSLLSRENILRLSLVVFLYFHHIIYSKYFQLNLELCKNIKEVIRQYS